MQASVLTPGCLANGDLWAGNTNYDGSFLNVPVIDAAIATPYQAMLNHPENLSGLPGTQTTYAGILATTGAVARS